MEAQAMWNEQRQAQLINKGLIEVEGMRFHSIEGGFGEGKKSMLAKEIAIIHGKDVGRINEAINRNRKRFTNGVDIIDLKNTEFAIDLCDSGIYTRNSINASSNIYLLSERGYAKLLKILEDDFAWEQYDKLVDGYFNMRAKAPKLSKELQAIFLLDERTVELDNRVQKLENTMTIDYSQQRELNSLAGSVIIQVLGGKGTPAYKELNKKAFSQLWRDYKRVMQVNSYRNTAVKDFEKGRAFILNWKVPRELELMIVGANSQISFN